MESQERGVGQLRLWAYKQRTGVLRYGAALSRGTIHPWEMRSVVVAGTALSYYATGEEDSGKPRGCLDLLTDHVQAHVEVPPEDAPTRHGCRIAAKVGSTGSAVEWKFCFDEQEDLIRFLDAVHSVLDGGGAYAAKAPDRFEHDFRAADHIFRWEMIVCPPVIYPIQIHGIVLEAGRNCVVVADFGLTGYGRKEGSEFNHVDDRHAGAIQAAWKKFRPGQDQRLNIVTLTDPMEIRKWTRARYDEESLFNKASHSVKTLEKLTSTMSKLKIAKEIKTKKASAADDSEGSSDVAEIKEAKSTSEVGAHTNKNGEAEELPQSDPAEIVLARANFLLEHMEVLPPYHVFYSNSECIAVWCKTGRWSTLQTAVFLSSNSVGAAKSSILATMGVAAAHALLAPVVAVGGLIWVGAPIFILQKSREKWEEITMKMTDLFWSNAEPIVYVAAIENWGGAAIGGRKGRGRRRLAGRRGDGDDDDEEEEGFTPRVRLNTT